MTNDQYQGLYKLQKWWRKYQNQFIEISGVIGTGIWELLEWFFEYIELDTKYVVMLSYDQKYVLELAAKKYHAYYIDGLIYEYTRIVDFDTLPVINSHSKSIKYEWKKKVKNKIDKTYKLMIVFDSTLLNEKTLYDLSSFKLPIILIKDPMLLPSPDTYTFFREANINLRELYINAMKSPITYFAHKIINNEPMKYGNFDNISVVSKKQMNLYNLKSSDMNITLSNSLKIELDKIFRSKILKRKDNMTVLNERVIVAENVYGRKLINEDEKRIKIYLTKGLVGNLSKVNKHALNTKYIGVDFKPYFYHESFTDLMMDRHYLNKLELTTQQLIPDEIIKFDYAYALTVTMSRLSHWDKVTLIVDTEDEDEYDIQQRLLYTAITRAKKVLTIII
jgi:hypothetical protein